MDEDKPTMGNIISLNDKVRGIPWTRTIQHVFSVNTRLCPLNLPLSYVYVRFIHIRTNVDGVMETMLKRHYAELK